MSKLAARITTGLTLAAVVLALIGLAGRLPAGRLALAVITGLALTGAWELDRMGSFRGRGLGACMVPAALLCSAWVGAWLFGFLELPSALVLAGLYVCAGLYPFSHGLGIRAARLVWGGEGIPFPRGAVPLSLWLFPPLFALVVIDHDFGTRGLFALVFLAKIGDNAGFFVGRAIGTRHPFPNVSPGKTVAGCVASLVAGIVAGAVVLPLTLGQRTLEGAALGAALGAVVNLAAQAGDLSESWVKRRAGVKDSSALLGPSGGVLDVLDSLFFAAPLALLAWEGAWGA